MAGNDGRREHIYHLMVKPEYRRNGIGKSGKEFKKVWNKKNIFGCI